MPTEVNIACDNCGSDLPITEAPSAGSLVWDFTVQRCTCQDDHIAEDSYESGREDGKDEGYDDGWQSGHGEGEAEGLEVHTFILTER
jgi:hypothetical protein